MGIVCEILEQYLHITLKQQIVLNTYMNVAIINASSKLIKEENPALAGLLPIVGTGNYISDGRLFALLLKITESHWITMSNVLTAQCHVSIYDSAQRLHYKRESKDIRYNVYFELDACSLRARPEIELPFLLQTPNRLKKSQTVV